MNRTLGFVLLALPLLALTAPARADLGPPVSVRLLGEPRAAKPGEPLRGELRVAVGAAGELSGFRFEGDGWTVLAIEAPRALTLDKGGSVTVPFTVVGDPSRPLGFVCEWNGRRVRRSLDLSDAAVAHALGRATMVAATVLPDGGPDRARPLTAPAPAPLPPDTVRPEGGGQLRGWNVRVHGRLIYVRSDGVAVGADGATFRVYDADTGADELLADGVTDGGGWYDVTFYWDPCFGCDGEPDIYVNFRASNAEITVEDATWEVDYAWDSPTYDNYTGSDLDLGWLQPNLEADQPALHIMTNLTRTWRWLVDNENYDLEHVDCQWPDGADGAWYNTYWEEIHISSGSQWSEGTFTHEYGHHWMEHQAQNPSPDYCNGYCDEGDCGHCVWCPENDAIVVTEGWPDWLADIVTRSFQATYGLLPLDVRNYEALGTCAPSPDDPSHTEGFFAALLRDIEDATQDDHPQYPEADVLAEGPDDIFATMDLMAPLDVQSFLVLYRVMNGTDPEDLWSTAFNCGYQLDVAPPGAITGLVSSHAINVPSPDATARFDWNRADDDASGVGNYAISVTTGGPVMPPPAPVIGNVTTWTSFPLAPGTYWFNIRAEDRAGRWSATYAAYGPFIVREPEPANLAFMPMLGWSGVLVPRPDAAAVSYSVPAPTWLVGESVSTWWSYSAMNTGEAATSAWTRTRLEIDGEATASVVDLPQMDAGAPFWSCNVGPVAVRGGRHTFEARLDALETIPETNELDNRWAHQWIWSPLTLSPGSPFTRSAPPSPTGGWDAIVDGSTLMYNCDGLYLNATGWWNVVSIRAADVAADFDLRLHPASTGPNDGFGVYQAVSQRWAGYLDAVIVNRNMLGTTAWDAGVVNYSGATCNYTIDQATSAGIPFAVASPVYLAQEQMLRVCEFYLSPENAGAISLEITASPSNRIVRLVLLDQAFTTGSLDDGLGSVATDASGVARLDANLTAPGWYGLVLYRDPLDGADPVSVTIEPRRMSPDLTPAWLAGWYAPLVPRSDLGTYPPPAPEALPGNVASTYPFMAVANASPNEAPAFSTQAQVDGEPVVEQYLSSLAPNTTSVFISGTPVMVRGGRHTFTMQLDPLALVEETNEDNNVYGEQWVWSPLALSPGAPVVRTAPPAPLGGWDHVTTSEPLLFNCDGLRLPAGPGWWMAVAVMPGAGTDVDLRLHEALPGVKDGFGAALAGSFWNAGQSDFVIVNFNQTVFAPYDVSAVLYSGQEDYQAETTAAITLDPGNPGPYGPWQLGSGRILDLREFYLTPGQWSLNLDSLEGAVDWGVTVHPADAVFLGKNTTLPDAFAWLDGPGQGEQLAFTVPASGWYCVAVWKVASDDLPLDGVYRLRLDSGTIGVEDPQALPSVCALTNIWPNPFNPQTKIAFDLAADLPVNLTIHDVRGVRVRTLVATRLPRGHHAATWDGRDDDGQPVASGVYLARFAAGGVHEMRKMVLLK